MPLTKGSCTIFCFAQYGEGCACRKNPNQPPLIYLILFLLQLRLVFLDFMTRTNEDLSVNYWIVYNNNKEEGNN